jgi:hypothetical protein
VAHLYAEWIRNGLIVAFAVGVPRAAGRLGWRLMWLAAAGVTAASVVWMHLRYGEHVLGWRSFIVAGAAVVIVLVAGGAATPDDGGAAPQPPVA